MPRRAIRSVAEAVQAAWAPAPGKPDALGELLAHAAARDVDDDARASAMADLRRADLDPAAAPRRC